MLEVSERDIASRLRRDNPWWAGAANFVSPVSNFPKRIYFGPFCSLATDWAVNRAVVLMGPRRVGKTVMLLQLVNELVSAGENPDNILYASIDAPIYSQIPLENFLTYFSKHPTENNERYFVLFDEIQYLKDWEIHLKDLVDRYRNIKFVASGSAAAALRLASNESGLVDLATLGYHLLHSLNSLTSLVEQMNSFLTPVLHSAAFAQRT
jgi:uncharacterized protein